MSCSPKHKSCSRWHSDLVARYRDERQRQHDAREEFLGMFNREGMERIWRENNNSLITFGEWLRQNRSEKPD